MIIGIDTGISGGMALWSEGILLECCEVPSYIETLKTKTRKGNYKKRRRLSYYLVAQRLYDWQKMGAKDIIIEKVHSMPLDSGIAAFSFGEAWGCFNGVSASLGLSINHVSPQLWKRHYSLIGKDKQESLELARDLFGASWFKLKKDHNKAEAALISASGLYEKGG